MDKIKKRERKKGLERREKEREREIGDKEGMIRVFLQNMDFVI